MRDTTVRGPAIDLGEFERRLRGPERKAGDASDPLSELARLMQGEEDVSADPYDRILANPSAARAQDAALRGSLDAPESRRLDDSPRVGNARAEPVFAEESILYAEQSGADHDGAEGGWTDDTQYLDYGAEDDSRYDEPRGLRRWLRPWPVVAMISVIAVGSIAWGFLHRDGGGGGRDIATITAPEGPVKVRPSATADTNAPTTGATVLDRKENVAVKEIVSNTEQAIDPNVAPKALKLGAGPVDAPHEPPALGVLPHKVKPVTVRPDGTRVDDASLPPAVAKAAKPAPGAEAPQIKGGTPKPAIAKPATTPTAAKPKPPRVAAVEDPPAETMPTDDAAAPIAKGGYAVQFGAATSEAEAKTLVKTVSTKYGAQLGGNRPSFKSATIGDKTVYRVRVGGLSKESAAAICGKVKAGGGACFVATN